MFTTPRIETSETAADRYSPTSDADSGRRLVRAFDAASDDMSNQNLSALRDAAIDFVGGLKDQGLPPERVVVALKTALRTRDRSRWEWVPSLDVEDAWGSTRSEPTVYARLFEWSVEAYYDEHARRAWQHPNAGQRDSALMTACPVGL